MSEWSKNLKSMTIAFENCESYDIHPECIEWFSFNGFKSTIMFQSPNDVFCHDRADCVKIHLSNLDKIKRNEIFQNEFKDRVHQYRDICYIRLNYEEGSDYGFYVPWNFKDGEQNNSWQNVKIEDGEMIIVISKKKPED